MWRENEGGVIMRQVIKDRIARLDVKISELQERYKVTTKASFQKNIEHEIARLLEQKEELYNKAIFGSMNQSKYDIGLEDRQFNLNNALDEQRVVTEQMTAALFAQNLEEAKVLRIKLGNCNRIVAIYQNSLNHWINKKKSLVMEKERKVVSIKDEREIKKIETPIDEEILSIINSTKKNPKYLAENKTTIELLTRQEPPAANPVAWDFKVGE